MSINLKQLFEIPGEYLALDQEIDLTDYELFDCKPFCQPVNLTGKIENKAGIVMIEYNVGFNLQTACDRCLEEFVRHFAYSFEHVLVKELNTDSDDYIVVEHETLDLADLALSDILLLLPFKLLCREDCAGLCQVCGKNLNHEHCDCEEKAEKRVDPRLAALGELLK